MKKRKSHSGFPTSAYLDEYRELLWRKTQDFGYTANSPRTERKRIPGRTTTGLIAKETK